MTDFQVVPCCRLVPKGGQEGGLAAEAGICGHDENPGADRPEGSEPGLMHSFLLQNSEIAQRCYSHKQTSMTLNLLQWAG